MTKSPKKPALIAYQVRDSDKGRGFWTRVGAAWANKDGGFSIQLDSFPLDGRIVLCPTKAEEQVES